MRRTLESEGREREKRGMVQPRRAAFELSPMSSARSTGDEFSESSAPAMRHPSIMAGDGADQHSRNVVMRNASVFVTVRITGSISSLP